MLGLGSWWMVIVWAIPVLAPAAFAVALAKIKA
jgi:hypothetical protein